MEEKYDRHMIGVFDICYFLIIIGILEGKSARFAGLTSLCAYVWGKII